MALDVGEKRIGVAMADTAVLIAFPHSTIQVDGTEYATIASLIQNEKIDTVVVGYPRSQSGSQTQQTTAIEAFTMKLKSTGVVCAYQDESVTSIQAEQRLKAQKKPYSKGDIDAMAATIILQDYLEANHGRI